MCVFEIRGFLGLAVSTNTGPVVARFGRGVVSQLLKKTWGLELRGLRVTPFGLNPQRIEQLGTRLNQKKAILERLPSTSPHAVRHLHAVERVLDILQDARSDEIIAQEMSELGNLLDAPSL